MVSGQHLGPKSLAVAVCLRVSTAAFLAGVAEISLLAVRCFAVKPQAVTAAVDTHNRSHSVAQARSTRVQPLSERLQ